MGFYFLYSPRCKPHIIVFRLVSPYILDVPYKFPCAVCVVYLKRLMLKCMKFPCFKCEAFFLVLNVKFLV